MNMINTKRRRGRRAAPSAPAVTHVAIYTRKSVEKGLDQQFNSLHAQREACEAYARSQQANGWTVLPVLYDDGGYSGANTDRPALKRLLTDIEEGKVDIVASYRFDRLSRRQIDFLRLLEYFEQHGVSFVSVTQSLDTSTSMGRCMLNVMIAFGQMERESIAERVRDKIRATRRRGGWTGGRPVLGYDVRDKKLVVNAKEAERVREIFRLYLESGSLLATVEELGRRKIRTKVWTTKKGKKDSGRPFTKTSLHALLVNPLYLGKIRAGDEVCEGQHEAIIDEATWDAVQDQLRRNGKEPTRKGKPRTRTRGGALLRGLLRCGQCGSAMNYHFATKNKRRYPAYVCSRIQKHGAAACRGSRAPAEDMEAFVVERIRQIGRDPAVVRETLKAVQADQKVRRPSLEAERNRLQQERNRLGEERKRIVDAIATGEGKGRESLLHRLDKIDREAQALAEDADRVRADLKALDLGAIDEDDLRAALAEFEGLWAQLALAERARLLSLLIETVTYNAAEEEIAIAFRPNGIRELIAPHEAPGNGSCPGTSHESRNGASP